MPKDSSQSATVDTGYQTRVTRAGNIVGKVKRDGVNQWKVITNSRSGKYAGVDGWTVTALLPGTVFKCNCPDYQAQILIGGNESAIARTWGGVKEGFYPCKHIIAVCMKEQYDFMQIIINELRTPARFNVAFTQKTTTAEEVLIPIGTSNQIQVYSITIELEGTSGNIITLKDGSGGTTLWKAVLTDQGDMKGFITNHVEYAIANDLIVEASTTETVNIYTRSINI